MGKFLNAVIKYKGRDLKIRDLEPKNLKSMIGNLAQEKEFEEFSKEEILEAFKKPLSEMLDKLKDEIENMEFK